MFEMGIFVNQEPGSQPGMQILSYSVLFPDSLRFGKD